MPEVAINVPFESNEVKDILCQEFRKRLDGLGPLQGAKEYGAFSADFQVKIKLRRTGEIVTDAKETMAWGQASKGVILQPVLGEELETAEEASHFDSRDPNEERQARDMPLTVEGSDGKGGRARRKVKVKVA